jgi:hypothetical protein
MGVFPLADTMSFFSNPPLSRGGHWHAAINGWTDEVWWYPRPTTTPRRNAAAAHSPIHYIAIPLALTRGPATDPSARTASAGRYIRRAPAVRTSDRTAGSAAERGPPSATSRMPSPAVPACMRHSSPVAAPAVLVFAAGGTRLQ